MIETLAWEHQEELAEAGALVDLEGVTCQIGNMVTRELTQQEVVRRARAMDTEQAVAYCQAMDLPKRQVGSQAVAPPQVGVISVDGGRYQRRDH